MTNNKKLRGSASVSSDGSFSFTPYVSQSPAEKSLRLVGSSQYSSLWMSKNKVAIRLCFQKNCLPPFSVWVEELTTMYNTLMIDSLNDF